eukprot:gb/GECG01014934.1/.p1 GENE.gb/GECG01014934.1/~~gb/GECG01014934.1/.p1  ORF type:complete len:101 (+),score=7.02 gb/GECG01014934.1/:1-303(+)
MGVFRTGNDTEVFRGLEELGAKEGSSSYSPQLKASQAFTVLSCLATLVVMCAASHGTAKTKWAPPLTIPYYLSSVVIFVATTSIVSLFLHWESVINLVHA